ncbi:MAG TPA: nuclear transport factor 2 family protein, partial [Jatrophihabitantaceae bacterium]|nr:nuclear transport factor 2 family protein [Jatrophihabitantaceae bacterium]
MFPGHQHLVAGSKIEIDGDRATGRTICHNPMPFVADDRTRLMIVGLWYLDRFVRTDAGWRILSRAQQRAFMHGV